MTVLTFPTLIGMTYPVIYAPTWREIRQEAVSGKDTRVQLWTCPRYHFEVPVSYMGSANANTDWQTMVGFWNALAGTVLPFHWPWSYDNAATSQSLGTGDGMTQDFNFVRALGTFVEPIQDVTAVSNVKVNGITTAAYTLLTDPNFGLTYGIHFTSAPGNGLSIVASFTYNWPCRFDGGGNKSGANDSTLDFDNFMFNFWGLKKIAFTTMKVI